MVDIKWMHEPYSARVLTNGILMGFIYCIFLWTLYITSALSAANA